MPGHDPLIMTNGWFPGYYWWGTDIHYLSLGLFIFSFYPGPWISAFKDNDREIS